MRRLIFFTLLIITNMSVATSSIPDDICSSRNDPARNLNMYEKVVHWFFEPKGISVQEAKFIANHPQIAKELKEFGEISSAHAHIFCQPRLRKNKSDLENSEADALRHFVFSTLAVYFHGEKGSQFLMAHEIKGGHTLTRDDAMDFTNNRHGEQFANELLQQKNKLTKEEVSYRALDRGVQLLRKGQLSLIEKVRAGPCKNLTSKKGSDLRNLIESHRKSFDKTLQVCLETDSL